MASPARDVFYVAGFQPELNQPEPTTTTIPPTSISPSTASLEPHQEQAVRFSSVTQEIEPIYNLPSASTLTQETTTPNEGLSPEAEAEIRSLSRGLQDSHLQHRRPSYFGFEPVSLPASRAPSNEQSPRIGARDGIRSGRPSPRTSLANSSIHTPPLTPATTKSRDGQQDALSSPGAGLGIAHPYPVQITPQICDPPKNTIVDTSADSGATSTAGTSRLSSASDQFSTQPTSLSQGSGITEALPKHPLKFTAGPSGDSIPPSRDVSPEGTPRLPCGTITPPTGFSRPFTPVGDRDDPYARSKRPPQSRNLDNLDARFIFGGRDSRPHSGIGLAAVSLASLPRSSSGNDLKNQEKHQSTFSLHSLTGKKDHHGHLHDDGPSNLGGKQHGSMSDLKRFLRIGHNKEKRAQSPAKSILNRTGARTPPAQLVPSNVPFADDHGLESKYGKFGKVLGSGAGGSVRLLKRSRDGVTFAVKQFRDRHTYESEREYAKKVTAEFCIGSTLHDGNIIETLDIIHEKGHWYEVMEYAPYDLFAIVMTGRMSREEIGCSFLQIFSGVTYLHSMGLAHRDLKLDNVVVDEHGIMKLIDFGSAIVFRYPFENDIVLASGVVGSDPYLAPEVYDEKKYDPQPADIWSLAIIFACMSLRRFPWKAPRTTDNSYKLFISAPTPGTESAGRQSSEQRRKSMTEMTSAAGEASRRPAPHPEVSSPLAPGEEESKQSRHVHHQEKSSSEVALPNQAGEPENQPPSTSSGSRPDTPNIKQEVVKGPWRLLRLLPRESRAVMGRMLEVNPRKRATLEEMLRDPWICTTPVCRQAEGGKVIRAEGHEHTLEPGTAVTATADKK